MTTKTKVRSRPEQLKGKTIKEASEEHKDSLHKINKRSVSVHSAGDGAASGELGGIFVPDAEQIAKINQFTKKTVTADDVVAFNIDAMNDLYDRDDERFTTATVKEFASLPQPFSFIGKSYMADHDYKMEKVRGRIFDVGTKGKQTELGHTTFLTESVYTANTPQYHDFIENLEFGLSWAVSVGVVVDKSECSICQAPVYTSRFYGWSWCEEGHEKGLYYVPGKEEDDGWGFFLPVDPSTKGAVKAQVDLKDAIDGYETSQVFLGAQYMAQISDKSVQKVFARAGRSKLPVLGVSRKEADLLNLPSEPKEVVEARQKYEVELKEGSFFWKDAAGLQWKYDPEENDSPLCLGKSGDVESELQNEREKSLKNKLDSLRTLSDRAKQAENETDDEDDDPVELAESLDAILDEADEAFDNGEIDQAEALVDGAETVVDQLVEVLGGEDADESDESGDGKGVKKTKITDKEVLSSALKAKLPQDILDKLAGAQGNTLETLLKECSKAIKGGRSEIKALKPKAELGDRYVDELEGDALHWFSVSRRDPKNPQAGVNVEFAQKMIQRCERDPELLKELISDYQAEARKKFPQPSRRSTVPEDPNEKPDHLPNLQFGPQEQDRRTTQLVGRLHSTGRK